MVGNLLIRIDHETSDQERRLDPVQPLDQGHEHRNARGAAQPHADRVARSVDRAAVQPRPREGDCRRRGRTPTRRSTPATTRSTRRPSRRGARRSRAWREPGQDGDQAEADVIPATDDGTGVYALARADLFNLLCIPPILPAGSAERGPRAQRHREGSSAAEFCSAHRAVFIVDPHPDWTAPSQITGGGIDLDTYITGISSADRKNAALYFPYFRAADPEQGGAIADFPPCGAIAGVMARTDGSSAACGRRRPGSTPGSRACRS